MSDRQLIDTMTPRAIEVLKKAKAISAELGHGCITLDHIALAIVQDGRGLANNVFSSRGVRADEIFKKLKEFYS